MPHSTNAGDSDQPYFPPLSRRSVLGLLGAVPLAAGAVSAARPAQAAARAIIGHGGGSLGTSTLLDVHLDSGWVVVFLFNYADRTTPPIQELIDDTRKLITTAAE